MLTFKTVALVAFLALCYPSKAVRHISSDSDDVLSAPTKRDKFRMLQSNVSTEQLKDSIDDFTSYGCERMVIISNDAPDWFRLWCYSPHDKTRLLRVDVGKSAILSFKPQKGGKSDFWCTLDYRRRWARFDVFSRRESYICPCDDDNVQKFSVRDDGVYTDGDKKIRALSEGRNGFQLHAVSNTNETEFLLTGHVDGGVCSDLPDEFEDKASIVTVCGYQCVVAYEDIHCTGKNAILQATGQCNKFQLGELDKKVSAIKGC